ncbi:50S ribosomal protein 6, chloroplastic [Cinnamomum micranthum f. kanehirae]|uniref:50S ribosomal protein 6, chloroplastic n=1 Tax=Cinnamomum micranthum f. kanehirae TaxID=337451 RepID=A0A3S3LYX8_9MAGN|nr:50S ribosomal protein 6, chloroplastic [Cinnamomum micranthum f. kanehirae]
MLVSALPGSRVFPTISNPKTASTSSSSPSFMYNGGSGVGVIECSSRPKKKATAHHIKTRPRKSQPWDIRRKPTVYPPLPTLPPDWTLFERPPETQNASAPDQEEEEEGED